MVELYCELLLARANVLDQLAFGEKGTRARLRAKELHRRQTQPQTAATSEAGAQGAGESPGPRFGFSWLGGGQKKQASAKGMEDSGNTPTDEEDAYLDTALDEAAVVVFYGWHRFPHELRELTLLRTMLGERYGKEFMTMAQDNKVDSAKVPDRLLKGLRIRPPGQDLVDNYLREIAQAYGVTWPAGEDQEALGGAPPEFVDDTQSGDDNGHGGGDLPETPRKHATDASRPDLSESRRASDASELNKATPPRGLAAGRSPVSVAPPAPRTDNPNPRVKLPGSENKDYGNPHAIENTTAQKKSSNNGIPELDELTRRFAELKRKP